MDALRARVERLSASFGDGNFPRNWEEGEAIQQELDAGMGSTPGRSEEALWYVLIELGYFEMLLLTENICSRGMTPIRPSRWLLDPVDFFRSTLVQQANDPEVERRCGIEKIVELLNEALEA